MRNDTPDRQQMHQDLQDLAKLASSPAPGAAREKPHGFESADSSGYVDLSAYRADDESWIERELTRAKAGGGAPSQRSIDGLSPQSMAPVALEALLAADDKLDDEAPARRRWPLVLGGIASVAAVAALAVVVARNAPHSAPKATQAAAVAPPAETTTTQATASTAESTPTQAPETTQPAASAAVVASAQAQPSSEPATKKPHATHARRWHAPAASPAVAAARPAAAPHPVAAPASHPAKSSGGSGDSLLDLIRASVKNK